MPSPRLAVFDLDGTLLPGNSFHLWLRWSLWQCLRHGRWLNALRLLIVLAKRAIGCINHASMKRQVIVLTSWQSERLRRQFAARLCLGLRPGLLQQMARHKQEGWTPVIVTAAPELYLVGLAEFCGASLLLGTPAPDGDWQETLGERKWECLQTCFGPQPDIAIFYTDHSDDLPLMRRATHTVLVAPRPSEQHKLEQSGLPCSLWQSEDA